jgi:MraZ protein
MVSFFGSSEHGLDDKGRLVLPGRILDQVAKAEWRFFLSASLDRCLLLHDPLGWQELVARLNQGGLGGSTLRNLRRRFLGHSEEVVPDATRRIRISDTLLNYAGLAASGPVVLVGTGRVIELWSPAKLGSQLDAASPEEEALFASLVGSNTTSSPGGA